MSPQSTVRLDFSVVDEVRTYSRLTGVPINRVIEDAVERYLETVGMVRLAGMIAEIKKRGSGWLSETERELLDREDAAGAIHLHNKEREVVLEKPTAPAPVYAPSGFLDGCEPEPEKVPELVKHHKAEIKKLEALLKASK